MYLVWAYTPTSVLAAHGITYYPSKQWAVALPAWVCVTVVFVYWVYERCAALLLCAGTVGPAWRTRFAPPPLRDRWHACTLLTLPACPAANAA